MPIHMKKLCIMVSERQGGQRSVNSLLPVLSVCTFNASLVRVWSVWLHPFNKLIFLCPPALPCAEKQPVSMAPYLCGAVPRSLSSVIRPDGCKQNLNWDGVIGGPQFLVKLASGALCWDHSIKETPPATLPANGTLPYYQSVSSQPCWLRGGVVLCLLFLLFYRNMLDLCCVNSCYKAKWFS